MTEFKPQTLDCAGNILDLGAPHVMGILNVTPDSFSDGGSFVTVDQARNRALEMISEGASIIDVGGESTRPGAQPVPVSEELDRVIPVIEAVAAETTAPISVDTSKPEVMAEAVSAGASIINDVNALREEGALRVAAELNVPICIMHMKGRPRTMQEQPSYENVVSEVVNYLNERVDACVAAGIQREKILIDPGFGFGKLLEHNLSLLHNLHMFDAIKLPVVVGVSRKSMIGQILDKSLEDRLYGSIALAAVAVLNGAAIIRAHDVKATYDAIRVASAVIHAGNI
ncbi:MAG: dihydropteroate synthase [Gammaproteobacteria bacterium]